MHQSIPMGDARIINVQAVNPGISKVQIKVCYVQDAPNRNSSVITKDFAQTILAQSLRGAPIVGHYNEETKDFEEHNKYLYMDEEGNISFQADTQVYGFVDLNANIWFQNFLDDSGQEREYLCTEGYLFTNLYPESNRVIEHGNNQSMELDEVEGIWTKDLNRNDKFFIVNEAIIKNLCILGEDVEPCFEGAQIKTEFSLEMQDLNKQLLLLMQSFTLMKEGGQQMDYKLEDIVEYQELSTQYSDLEKQFNDLKEQYSELEKQVGQYNLEDVTEYQELKSQYDELVAEAAELRQFKADVIKEQKEAKIEEFNMLADEDKADVREHIDEYSLDEIESKLAVICFKKKINFNIKDELQEEEEKVPELYQLQNDGTIDSLGAAFKSLDEEDE